MQSSRLEKDKKNRKQHDVTNLFRLKKRKK